MLVAPRPESHLTTGLGLTLKRIMHDEVPRARTWTHPVRELRLKTISNGLGRDQVWSVMRWTRHWFTWRVMEPPSLEMALTLVLYNL